MPIVEEPLTQLALDDDAATETPPHPNTKISNLSQSMLVTAQSLNTNRPKSADISPNQGTHPLAIVVTEEAERCKSGMSDMQVTEKGMLVIILKAYHQTIMAQKSAIIVSSIFSSDL